MPQMKCNALTILSLALVAALMLFMAGCSDSNSDVTFDETEGHPENWVEAHGEEAIEDSTECAECHGADLQGGISGLNCFSASNDGTACHGSLALHGAAWDNPGLHGAAAKAVPGEETGFESCKECHGDGYEGGAMQVSCFTAECHGVDAPHPQAPWLGSSLTHTDTDEDNASVCAECHRNESGADVPQTTAPGCFNNTLCHAIPGHVAGWETDHSLDARVSTETCGTSNCHGTDFTGGEADVSCFECHLGGPSDPGLGAGIMHPSTWTSPAGDHIAYLAALGDDATSCSPSRSGVAQYCHGDGLPDDANANTAPPNGSWGDAPTCYDCHGQLWTAP
jgi:hypothetical protein